MTTITTPDYGLLKGLADGANSFLISYQTSKNLQHQQKMQELASGVERDADGNLQLSPEAQMHKQAGLINDQQTIDSASPGSELSKRLAKSRGILANAGNPNISLDAFKDTSANDQKALEGYGKADLAGYMSLQKMLNNPLIDVKRGTLDETKNTNASKVGNDYENNSILKNSKIKSNAMTQSSAILNNPNKPVTANDFNAAYQDYLAGTAPGGVPTEGKAHREIPDTFDLQWNTVKSKLGQYDDLRADPAGRQLIDLLQKNIASSQNELRQQIKGQARHLHENYLDSTNQKVRNTNERKFHEYYDDEQPTQGLLGQSAVPQQDPQIALKLKRREELLRKASGG
jgi:hypothetical protein